MRVDSRNVFYHNGILMGSLDGYYGAIVAENSKIRIASNSDEIFIFSLYQTNINSKSSKGLSREHSLKRCLKQSISEGQRRFAFEFLEVSYSYSDPEKWDRIKTTAYKTLKKIHEETPFDEAMYAATLYNAAGVYPVANSLGAEERSACEKISFLEKNQLNQKANWLKNWLKKIIFAVFLPDNIIVNSNFIKWRSAALKYSAGAWIDLPAESWVGHFDCGAKGVFQKDSNVPNSNVSSSLAIIGVEDSTNVYLGQMIPAESMLKIRYKGLFYVSGYLYCAGENYKCISLNFLEPSEKNNFSSYQSRLEPLYIDIKKLNTWQHFELTYEIENKAYFSNGAIAYFLMDDLTSPEEKIYFSQIKIGVSRSSSTRISALQNKILSRINKVNFFHKKPAKFLNKTLKINEIDINPEKKLDKNLLSNDSMAYKFLELNRIEDLVERLVPHLSSLTIGKKCHLSREAAAYFWIGNLYERVINKISNISATEKLLAQCEEALRTFILLSPLYVDGYRVLARNLWTQGRHDESLAEFQRAEEQRNYFMKLAGLDPKAAVLLPVNCAHVIGLMGHLDAFMKNKVLTNDTRPYHLVVPESEIVNKVFFEYWKQFLQLDFPSVNNVDSATITMAYTADWNWVIPQDSGKITHIHTHAAMARIQRQWAFEGRKPLLTLNDKHKEVLSNFKLLIGLNNNDWFVCFHVRSGDFYGERKNTAQDFRNTPIEDYHLAMKAVVDAGGWVFRMGDNKSPLLTIDPDSLYSKKIIDYAHSTYRSEELDVALSASCKLFVSSPSGLHTVAHAFGRPVCYVNYPIYAGFPWHPNEIFIPMLYYSISKHQVLSINEILSSDLVYADHNYLLQKKHVVVLRNTPDEIAETVLEALHGHQYTLLNNLQANAGRQEFEYLNQVYNRDISGQIGLYFSMKYFKKLFPTVSQTGAIDVTETA